MCAINSCRPRRAEPGRGFIAYCETHLPAYDEGYDSEEERVAAADRLQRHGQLLRRATESPRDLARLHEALADRTKPALRLSDLALGRPALPPPGQPLTLSSPSPPPPTLLHALASAPPCPGREACSVDGLSLAICHAMRAQRRSDERQRCAPSADELGAVAAAEARRALRQCCPGCIAAGLPALDGVNTLLGACCHSPFGVALRGGNVERALWLYFASLEGGPAAAEPPCSEAAAKETLEAVGAALAVGLVGPAAGAASREGDGFGGSAGARTRVAQLLMLLAARAAMPSAGSEEQLAAARASWPEGVWPALQQADGVAREDLSCGAEIGAPSLERGADDARPAAFLYVSQCVAAGVQPEWPTRAKLGGCRCSAERSRFCSRGTGGRDGCRCQHAKSSECGYGCSCSEQPDRCGNRALQRGVRKRLLVFPLGGKNAAKGWGVKAGEPIQATLSHCDARVAPACPAPPSRRPSCPRYHWRPPLPSPPARLKLVRRPGHRQAGEFVCEYVGEIITAAEAERREAACPAAGLYHFELSGGRFLIDAFAVRNVAAFINFSCDPNLEPRRLDALSGDKSLPRVGFFARREAPWGGGAWPETPPHVAGTAVHRRDIKTGDELGYRRDPNATTRKNRSGSIVCLCGSKNCVGRV